MERQELIHFTLATLTREEAWSEVQNTIARLDPPILALELEEALVIAAGLALQLSQFLEVDAHRVLDSHYEVLNAEIALQGDE